MDNGASSYRRFRDEGDMEGLADIIRDYKDGLIFYLCSILGNIHTAEDIAEDSVYTVKETPDLLLVVKADSSSVYGSVIPMCSSSFSGDSYGYGSLVPNLTIPDGAVIN